MRHLATIQKICDISPIEGADKIEVATIKGWKVVVLKDQFKVGDFVVYAEIDSVLPGKPEFEFLRERKFRVRTIKLRGQISQGICFPLSILPHRKWAEGDDVTDVIGIKKYDPQAEIEEKEAQRKVLLVNNKIHKWAMRNKWYRKLIVRLSPKPNRLPFPAFISKTDEERIQNIPEILTQYPDAKWYATEKLDGCSATYFACRQKGWFKSKVSLGVCSRNFQLLKDDGSAYWKIYKQCNIAKTLNEIMDKNKNITTIAIQGEIIGDKIQGNKYGLKGYDFYAFNLIIDGERQELPPYLITGMYGGLKWVPMIYRNAKLFPSVDGMVETANGKSVLADIPREGLVFRTWDDKHSFKVVSPEFLLKYGE